MRVVMISFSKPEIVYGSVTPPPSRFLPGQKCYMVQAWVGNQRYHGLGPTPDIAKAAAKLNAEKVTHSCSQPQSPPLSPNKDMVSELLRVAHSRGSFVSFDTSWRGRGARRVAIVNATAGNLSTYAFHKDKEVARVLAAEKLLDLFRAVDTHDQVCSDLIVNVISVFFVKHCLGTQPPL